MMRNLSLSLVALLAAACSGGGGSSAAAAPRSSGTVQVLLDTATGTSALVEFQVVAAALATNSGGMTANLLAAPKMLTLADPTGEADALVLTTVPTGTYTSLHLGLAPTSGVAVYPNGIRVAVTAPFDLVIPFGEALQHDSSRPSWVATGHNGTPPPASATSAFAWSPALIGRSSGSSVSLNGLDVAVVAAPELTAQLRMCDDAPLSVTFASNCTFLDDDGSAFANRGNFLAAANRGDDLQAEGDLTSRGQFEVRHVRRRGRGNDDPRLIGRIASLEPATTSFVMDVLAEARRHGAPSTQPLPAQVRVLAANARIEQSNRQPISFGQLAVGNLVKVEWLRRNAVVNGLPELVAREVEVAPSGGVGMRPEWQGSVQAVDLVQRVITIVRHHDDPIVVQGQSLTSVELHIDTGVPIERRANGGGGRTQIALEQIVPGQDRIWWRGAVTGPSAIEASWVRVRDDS